MKKRLVMFLLMISGAAQAQLADFGNIDFREADSVAALYKGEDLKSLPILAQKLTSTLPTKVEQFRAIYTWVCNNIKSDHAAFLKNQRKRKKLYQDSTAFASWNASFQTSQFKKLLNDQKTVCTGYAYLVKKLAALADIKCEIVSGYGRTVGTKVNELKIPNHSWNAVALNGKWYLCDATWSSGYFHLQKNSFIHDYEEGYFLANPELFVQNHYPINSKWILMDDKPSFKQFQQAPLIYKHAFTHRMIPTSPQEMKMEVAKNERITFSFKTSNLINTADISLELMAGAKQRVVKPTIQQKTSNVLTIAYVFDRLGYYDVHVKVGEDYIVTYIVVVKKN